MNTIKKTIHMFLLFLPLLSPTLSYCAEGLTNNPIEVSKEVQPSYTFEYADHVANGTMMRNRSSGTIQLRGVPQKAEVLKGLLYFSYIDQYPDNDQNPQILFDGNLLQTRQIAISREPCWEMNMAALHSFVCDVTDYILCRAHPNQDYSIVLPFTKETNTSGENPWKPDTHSPDRLLEGATLIIVYKTEDTRGPLFIYDRLDYTMFSRYGRFTLYHPELDSVRALFTLIGADGQRGQGHDNIVSNEYSLFNGIQIAGPQWPVHTTTNIDWDGSDGWPLIQLWDTHSHYVMLYRDHARVQYIDREPPFDCLVPVAFVIDVQ